MYLNQKDEYTNSYGENVKISDDNRFILTKSRIIRTNNPQYFNKPIKEKYLQTLSNESEHHNTERFLKKFGTSYENILNKDLGEMNCEDIKRYFSNANMIEFSSIQTKLMLMKKYINWIQENKIFEITCNPINNLTLDMIDIQQPLKRAIVPNIDVLTDNLYKLFDIGNCMEFEPAMAILAWYGLTENKMRNLKKQDVDFHDASIHTDGHRIRITHKPSVEILKKYCEGKGYLNRLAWETEVSFIDSPQFFRGYYYKSTGTPVGSGQFAKSAFNRGMYHFNTKYFEKYRKLSRFTVRTLNLSGELYRLYEKDIAGELNDCNFCEITNLQFSQKALIHAKKRQYIQYKAAFWNREF